MNPDRPQRPSRNAAPSPAATLHKLFLTLFLRGRSARGLQKSGAPTTLLRKLSLTLVFYAIFGALATSMRGQPILTLALYLHVMVIVFLALFIASSSGELLFNQDEADILLPRPITPRMLLWAKVRVLLEVSLWIAFTFNLVGFYVGLTAPDGSWRFLAVHAFSTALGALFCLSVVVLAYHLCLQWFGREKLDNVMTAAQVLVTFVAVGVSQAIPYLLAFLSSAKTAGVAPWMVLLPPAWFAGIDDALAGSSAITSWWFAIAGLLITAILAWAAFSELAKSYGEGMQKLAEAPSGHRGKRAGRRWVHGLTALPPIAWTLRDPVVRAAFLLTAGYLARDRDTKLRVYPTIAPMLMIPFFMLFTNRHGDDPFALIFSGAYLAIAPMLTLMTLQYSQQWLASDLFRIAPITGPGPICTGARRAVLLLIALPACLLFIGAVLLLRPGSPDIVLVLPGLVAMPLFAILPHRNATAVPFSVPTEGAKAANRGLIVLGSMMASFAVSGAGFMAWKAGFFWPFLALEVLLFAALSTLLVRRINAIPWPATE
jgi:hypothetical protein